MTDLTEPRDTIAAIATPPGRGGIGILRLSGPDALAIAAPLLRLRGPLQPNRARFCEIIDPGTSDPGTSDSTALPRTTLAPPISGSTTIEPATKLDEAIATYFQKPNSYTGEDVLEIAAHGSPVLLDFLLRQTIARGARLANPGEFTERAFLAGRLDLTQAEAVRDLIDAQTLYQARIAASQLDGALSRRIAPIKTALIALIAQLEAGIDFAEDDTPTLAPDAILAQAAPIAAGLATLAHSFEHGRLVHSGFTLAIVGEPNVGKSSLFNRLAERARAIVTATPGTTRDLVTERVSLAGIPVELVDTAGLRSATPTGPLAEAERLGIEKSREALADADLVLLVLDASPAPAASNETGSLLHALESRRAVVIFNKCDLLGDSNRDSDSGSDCAHMQQQRAQIEKALPGIPIVLTSAQTGVGLATLRETIQQQLQIPALGGESGMLTNLRQHQAVQTAHRAIEAARAAAHLPHEMLLLDLYTALQSLDALTGQTTSDDILNLIFSTFCIGK